MWLRDQLVPKGHEQSNGRGSHDTHLKTSCLPRAGSFSFPGSGAQVAMTKLRSPDRTLRGWGNGMDGPGPLRHLVEPRQPHPGLTP